MRTQKNTSGFSQALHSPRESKIEREQRERQSLRVAKDMLKNGCCTNTVTRYTGLSEEQLKNL